jgi:hypothetical protein
VGLATLLSIGALAMALLGRRDEERQSIITCLTFRESMRDRDHTVGSYLAARLTQIGLNHNFAMRVTSTSPCSTSFWTNKDLEQIYCCNELNCGYSPLSQG